MKSKILILFSILFAFTAKSQEDDLLLVSEIKQSTVITEPATLHKGFFKLGTVSSFIFIDKLYDENAKKVYMMGNGWMTESMHTLDLFYGITNRFQVLVSVPYMRRKVYYSNLTIIPVLDQSERFGSELKGNGLGDAELGLDYQIIEGSKTKPSLVSHLTLTFPSGEKNYTNYNSDSSLFDFPTGAGEIAVNLGLRYRKIIYPFSYSFNGSYKYYFKGKKTINIWEDETEFKSGGMISLGGSFNFLLNDWIAIQNELYFHHFEKSKYYYDPIEYGNSSWSVSYIPEVHFQFRKFRFVQGVMLNLIGKNSGADPTFILIAQYIF
jgi:hypothetical protein